MANTKVKKKLELKSNSVLPKEVLVYWGPFYSSDKYNKAKGMNLEQGTFEFIRLISPLMERLFEKDLKMIDAEVVMEILGLGISDVPADNDKEITLRLETNINIVRAAINKLKKGGILSEELEVVPIVKDWLINKNKL